MQRGHGPGRDEATSVRVIAGHETRVCRVFQKVPELFDALLECENTAGNGIGTPFLRLFHFFNNL